jgi:hypothetical protein
VRQALKVSIEDVDREVCRKSLRRDCKEVKFCCAAHTKKAKLTKKERSKRGPRQGLTVSQFSFIFDALVTLGFAWASVLALFQVLLGERVSCTRHLVGGDLHGFGDHDEQDAFVALRRVNKKTKARIVPVSKKMSERICLWMTTMPLGTGQNTWPFPGQDVSSPECPLFPGQHATGTARGQRNWSRPVSRQAFLFILTNHLQPHLKRELQKARKAKRVHVMDGVEIDRIGTHSFKRTSVMALADVCRSLNVVSAITGTTARTLAATYDTPTAARQRTVVERAFMDLLPFASPSTVVTERGGIIWL